MSRRIQLTSVNHNERLEQLLERKAKAHHKHELQHAKLRDISVNVLDENESTQSRHQSVTDAYFLLTKSKR